MRRRKKENLAAEAQEFIAGGTTKTSRASRKQKAPAKPAETRVALTVRLDPDTYARLKVALVHKRAQKSDGPRTAQDLFEHLVEEWLERNE